MTVRQVSNLFNKVADKKLNLVGVALDNKYIDPMTNVEPVATIANDQGHSLMVFTFTPVGRQYEQLNQFNEAIKDNNAGRPAEAVLEPVPDPDKDAPKLMAHQSDVVTIGVYLDDAQAEVESLLVNKIKFYKAILNQKIGDSDLEVTLLFREKTGSSERFFSGFVDKTLTPKTGIKVLTLIGERLTGFPISYVTSASEALTMTLLPISSPLAVTVEDDKLTVANATAQVGVDLTKVTSVHVLHSLEDEYLVTVRAPKNVAIIALHR